MLALAAVVPGAHRGAGLRRRAVAGATSVGPGEGDRRHGEHDEAYDRDDPVLTAAAALRGASDAQLTGR
jgi:hypothetical protein